MDTPTQQLIQDIKVTHTHMHIHSCFCNVIFLKHCCNRLISGELSEFGGGGADLQEEPNTALHTPPSTYSAPAFILWRFTAKLWVKHTHIHTHILKYTLIFINTCICMFLADKGRSYGTLQAEALKLFNILHQLEDRGQSHPSDSGNPADGSWPTTPKRWTLLPAHQTDSTPPKACWPRPHLWLANHSLHVLHI